MEFEVVEKMKYVDCPCCGQKDGALTMPIPVYNDANIIGEVGYFVCEYCMMIFFKTKQ